MKLESMRDESFDVVQISVICLRGRDMGLVVVASSKAVFKKRPKSIYVAYRLVHNLAILSCSSRF